MLQILASLSSAARGGLSGYKKPYVFQTIENMNKKNLKKETNVRFTLIESYALCTL